MTHPPTQDVTHPNHPPLVGAISGGGLRKTLLNAKLPALSRAWHSGPTVALHGDAAPYVPKIVWPCLLPCFFAALLLPLGNLFKMGPSLFFFFFEFCFGLRSPKFLPPSPLLTSYNTLLLNFAAVAAVVADLATTASLYLGLI